ncbi:hypothetical protein [Mesotoga sp.]|uniref:hypothetical protein n=1 Tax=Mesotoga sp. TaxID=2053577 RepID=UPI0002CBAEC4|nr:exported hypothetical protein [Mesotoga infera]
MHKYFLILFLIIISLIMINLASTMLGTALADIEMLNSDTIRGRILNEDIVLITDYGELSLPIDNIREIATARGGNIRTTLKSNFLRETFTGVLLSRTIELETEDGILKIPSDGLKRITIDRKLSIPENYHMLKTVDMDLFYCEIETGEILVQTNYGMIKVDSSKITRIVQKQSDKSDFEVTSSYGTISGTLANKQIEFKHPSGAFFLIDSHMISKFISQDSDYFDIDQIESRTIEEILIQESLPAISKGEAWGTKIKIPEKLTSKTWTIVIRVRTISSPNKSFELWLAKDFFGKPFSRIGFLGDGGITHSFRYSLIQKSTYTGEIILTASNSEVPQEFYLVLDNSSIGNTRDDGKSPIKNIEITIEILYLRTGDIMGG